MNVVAPIVAETVAFSSVAVKPSVPENEFESRGVVWHWGPYPCLEMKMKNIQVIDGAENCSFSICLVDDDDFAQIFPGRGQDVEFIEDLVSRVGEKRAAELVARGTTRRIHKRDAMGVHGTLLFGLGERRKYFPNKREDDIDKQLFVSLPLGRTKKQ